jgi:hypothetical protein
LGSRDAQRTGGELCIVANRGRIRAAEGIGGRVKFLPLAWAGMPKTSFRKNSDSLQPISKYQKARLISPYLRRANAAFFNFFWSTTLLH